MHIQIPNIVVLLCSFSLHVTFLNSDDYNKYIFANAQPVLSNTSETIAISMYGIDPAPIDIIGYTDEAKAEACRSLTHQKLITPLKMLKFEFIDLLKKLKAPNEMDLTSLLNSVHYTGDDSEGIEILSQFRDTVDDIARSDSIFKCPIYDWCAKLQNKAILMEKAMNSIKAKLAKFGTEYMPQTFIMYPGRVKCKAPFQWFNILQTLGAFLHCSSVCNSCQKASKYNRCEFLPVLQMHPTDKDDENGGKNNPEKPKNSRPVVVKTFNVPMPDKANIPRPPDDDDDDDKNEVHKNASTVADETDSVDPMVNNEKRDLAFLEIQDFPLNTDEHKKPVPTNMLERVLSVIPLKPPDDYENTIPISVNLEQENGIEIKGLLDFLTSYDNPTNFVFDVRWEDERRSDRL